MIYKKIHRKLKIEQLEPPLTTWSEVVCSGMMASFFSTSGTRRVKPGAKSWTISFANSCIQGIQFVSDLRQVDGFLRVLRFPPPIKLTATI